MASFGSWTKCLKSTCKIFFYCVCWLNSCNFDMREAFSRSCSTKIVFWKAQNSQVNAKSSHPEMFCRKSVLKHFAKFTVKHLCWSAFLIKLMDWRPALLLERDSSTAVSAFREICITFRWTFLYNTTRRQFLICRHFFLFCRSARFAAFQNCYVEHCYIRIRKSHIRSVLRSCKNQARISLS